MSTIKPEDKVIKYLGKKYGDSFEVVDSISGNIDINYEEFYCVSESYPDDTATVFIDRNGNMTDNYYAIIKHDELEKKYIDAINSELNDYKLFFNITSDYIECNPDLSLDEALNDNPYQFSTVAYVFLYREVNDKNSYEKICKKLKDNKCYTMIAFYEVTDEEYNEIDKDNYLDYLNSKINIIPSFEKTVN